jgi:hypothetical protein
MGIVSRSCWQTVMMEASARISPGVRASGTASRALIASSFSNSALSNAIGVLGQWTAMLQNVIFMSSLMCWNRTQFPGRACWEPLGNSAAREKDHHESNHVSLLLSHLLVTTSVQPKVRYTPTSLPACVTKQERHTGASV